MPDISVPDALTLGGVIAAAIVALLGRKTGDAANKVKPAEPSTSGIAAGFVDKDLMVRLTMATESIAGTLKAYLKIQTDKHEQEIETLLKEIKARLPDAP